MPDELPDELTVDELARQAGMTVRNIRAHQSRGLLPPPTVRVRTGYYGPEHVARLHLIREMQDEGFNLTAIQRLLEATNGAGEEVLRFGRAALGAFGDEEPELSTAEELEARLGGPLDPDLMARAERLRLIRPLGDSRYEIPSPTLLRAGEELVSLGIPIEHALDVAEKIDRHSRSIAEAFVQLFLDDVVGAAPPVVTSGEDWERLEDALERLRPLATQAVRAGFQQTMARVVERHLERTLDAGAGKPRRRSGRRTS
jgi:DNA-binding transcriptional MerR regulator